MNRGRREIAFCFCLFTVAATVSFGSASGEPLSSTMARSEPIEHGFVLIDGVDIAPPFVIEWRDDQLQINGHRITLNRTGRLGGSPKPGRWNGRPDGRPGVRNVTERQVGQLETQLNDDALLVAWDDQTIQTFYATTALDVLEVLCGDDDQEGKTEALVALATFGLPSWRCRELSSRFRAGPGLADRVEAARKRVEATRAAYGHYGTSTSRFEFLSILGFLLSVGALGTFLLHRPQKGKGWHGTDPSPEAMRQVVYSVALLIALAGFDLLATLLTVRSGAMFELNPLARGMLQTPAAVTLFKVTATGLAAAVFLAYRRRRSVQLASWWAGITYTALLLRWSAVSTMLTG